MKKLKPPRIGIIAEDESDVESAKVLIRRISARTDLDFKRNIGNGCGRIARKCHGWAKDLRDRGCTHLILIQDLDSTDSEELSKLTEKLKAAISPSPIPSHLICIPVEELEAWWLSDPNAIKVALELDAMPRVEDHPEVIASPKEYIDCIVRRCSANKKQFLNTKHNPKIAANLNFVNAKSCESFKPFFDFVEKHFKH